MAKGVILGQDSSIKPFGENVVEDWWSVENKNGDGIIITDSLVRTLVGGRGFVVKKDTVEFGYKEAKFVLDPSDGNGLSPIGSLLGMENLSQKILYNGFIKDQTTTAIPVMVDNRHLLFIPCNESSITYSVISSCIKFISTNTSTDIYGPAIYSNKTSQVNTYMTFSKVGTSTTNIRAFVSGRIFIW